MTLILMEEQDIHDCIEFPDVFVKYNVHSF